MTDPTCGQLERLDTWRRDRAGALRASARRAAGADGLAITPGAETDCELALDWWLRAAVAPGVVWVEGDVPVAIAVALPPEWRAPFGARWRWWTRHAWRGQPDLATAFQRRLHASERQRPTAPHFFVPLLAAADGPEAAQRLLAAIESRSAAHPVSCGVCCDCSDAPSGALLEERGYRPVARYRVGGVRSVVRFRPDAADAPFPEPVVVPIADSIDLHRFRPAEIDTVVRGYLDAAVEAGLREVRIIHGRGRGVQRHRVRLLLDRDERVERFADAPADRGGIGATVAWLCADAGARR